MTTAPHSTHVAYVGGLDLGKLADYAALVICEVLTHGPPVKPPVEVVPREVWGDPDKLNLWLNAPKPPAIPQRRYRIRHVEQFERGTAYHAIAAKVVQYYGHDFMRGRPLAIDWTGVGEPVLEIIVKAFRENEKHGGNAKAFFQPVKITAGTGSRPEGVGWHVAKEELVGVLLALFNNGQLEFRNEVPGSGLLRREMDKFKEKKTAKGNATWEADKAADHDDLVMALALAAWVSERCQQDLKVWC